MPAFLLANLTVDLEPAIATLLELDPPPHGPVHTLVGAATGGAVTGWILWRAKGLLEAAFRDEYELRSRVAMLSGAAGGAFHVLLDSVMYGYLRPFFPLEGNPLHWPGSGDALHLLAAVMLLPAAILLIRARYWETIPRSSPSDCSGCQPWAWDWLRCSAATDPPPGRACAGAAPMRRRIRQGVRARFSGRDAPHRQERTTMTAARHATSVPKASARDTLAVTAEVLMPFVARGPIARRPKVVGLAEKLDADRRAVRRMQHLRDRYGPGPVLLRTPGRDMAMVVSASHVHRVLEGTPEPFATANREKRGALSHFQPHGVLISDAGERAVRRPFNEAVLDTPSPIHHMAEHFVAAVREEADLLLDEVEQTRRLTWDAFITAWWRTVRRVVLGDAARDDHALTDMLTELRHDANWSFFKPKDTELRERFERQLLGHIRRAEPNSLAHLVATLPADDGVVRHQQVPQWLFAFDPAGMTTFRALALLAAHPDAAARVRAELEGRDLTTPQDLPYLRGTVLESLRLWPTTPSVLRDTTTETTWETGTLPAGTGVTIFAPLFHRDDEELPYADRFAPEIWLEDRSAEDWPLVPFSGGPGMCPGRNLVLLTTSTMLAALLSRLDLRLDTPGTLDPAQLPGTLSPYHLRFVTA
jgi:cytochrome P450